MNQTQELYVILKTHTFFEEILKELEQEPEETNAAVNDNLNEEQVALLPELRRLAADLNITRNELCNIINSFYNEGEDTNEIDNIVSEVTNHLNINDDREVFNT